MVVCRFFQQGNCRYGHNCRFEHVYSSKYSYRAPQALTTQSRPDLFNTNLSSERHLSHNGTASSLFRNAVQNISILSSHPVAQSQPTRISVFERLGPQPNNAFSNQNTTEARSIFAQANQSVFGQTRPVTNILQTQNQTSAKSIFAQASQSIFGHHHQQPNSNFVIEPQKSLPISGNTSGNVFQMSNRPTSNVFGGTNIEQNCDIDENVYSKMEDLTQSDIEAFESADFKLGFIPELPPPKVLCV